MPEDEAQQSLQPEGRGTTHSFGQKPIAVAASLMVGIDIDADFGGRIVGGTTVEGLEIRLSFYFAIIEEHP